MLYDVVILTEGRYVNPESDTQYVKNILLEDNLVLRALEDLGLRVIRLSWSNPNFDWSSAKCALFRTTWDYFHRFDEFQIWLDKVSKQTTLINDLSLVRWNMDKHYLKDLKAKGINIPETIFLHRGTDASLKEWQKKTDWQDMILKPTIAGTARHTYKLDKQNLEEHQLILDKLLIQEDMMLQPFLHNIVERGEISLVIINGRFAHAVLKVAKPGEFRVQDDFGGSVHDYSPIKEEIEFAEQALEACPSLPLYARVDICYDNNDELAIGELEIIEPELWFRKKPEAAKFLATAIKQRHFNNI